MSKRHDILRDLVTRREKVRELRERARNLDEDRLERILSAMEASITAAHEAVVADWIAEEAVA